MAAEVVRIGTVSCEPGFVARGIVEVAKGPDGSMMGFPVMIVNGALPGKRLCTVAGVHGDEPEGMEAVRRVVRAADPSTLRGALIGLPCVNPPAFDVAARCSGIDHLDFNRVFPGDRNGTLSMRWAAKFGSEVIPNIDALVDLHTGGGFGEISPQTIVQGGYEQLAMELGLAVGYPVIWRGGKWGGTARACALQAGKAAVTCQVGGGGGCKAETVDLLARGVLNAMRLYGMVEGKPETPSEYREVTGGFIRSSAGGFFRPEASPGDAVKEGEIIARVIDHYGEDVELFRAPHDGVVLGIRRRSTVFAGEEAVIFGKVVETIKP